MITQWHPSKTNTLIQPNFYAIESFNDEPGVRFEFILESITNKNYKIYINFPLTILAYQSSAIASKKDIISLIEALYGKDGITWPFYILKESEYIKWLVNSHCNIEEENEFELFVLLSKSTMFEIIKPVKGSFEPNIKIL